MRSDYLKKKMLAIASAGTILFSGIFTSSCMNISNYVIDQKPYNYVLRDYQNFKVDTEIADALNYSCGYAKNMRLKFSDSKPVIVDCEEGMEVREKEIVQKIVDYYNMIFSTINDNYKFVIKNDSVALDSTDTVISVSNGDLSGALGQHVSNFEMPDLGEGTFVVKSEIVLDWNAIKDMDDLYVFGVILHEFGHALGFGDVYYEGDVKNVSYMDMTTMMQLSNVVTNVLYPNDYAVLQALYSNEYQKHDNYEDAVKVVNEKIANYTRKFYEYYAGIMKDRYGATDLLAEGEIGNNVTWFGDYTNNFDTNYELNFLENNKCELIIRDKTGNILEKGEGETLFVNGVLFVKRICLDRASNYAKLYDDSIGMKLMLCLYKNNDGNLIIRDATSFKIGEKNLQLKKVNKR